MIEIARSPTSSGAVDLTSLSGGTGATRLATAYFVPGDELPEGIYNEQAARFRLASAFPCWSPVVTSSRRWPRPVWRPPSTSSP
jgi:hypothetical protein